MVLSPDAIRLMEQLAEGIVCKLVKFIKNEQAFSPDFYISATEPLMRVEELLDYLRLYLPDRPDLVEAIEQERSQLFEWAHIGNGEKSSDTIAISGAKGHTKGFAMRLVEKLRLVTEFAAESAKAEIAAEKPGETEPETARGKLWRIRAWFKALIKEAYRLAMRSFFDSAMHK